MPVEIGVALAGIDRCDVAPLKMRFGLHLEDVAMHDDDLIGDGVNLFASGVGTTPATRALEPSTPTGLQNNSSMRIAGCS
jgi:hypothetical protein